MSGYTLLPCPFCGHEADQNDTMFNMVGCEFCGATGPLLLPPPDLGESVLMSREQARAAWNTRASASQSGDAA